MKEKLLKKIQREIENITNSVDMLSTEDEFIKKQYRKISQEKGYDVLKKRLENGIIKYNKTKEVLKQNNLNFQEYDNKMRNTINRLSPYYRSLLTNKI